MKAGSAEQCPKVAQVLLVPSASKHFHHNGVGDGDSTGQEPIDLNTDRRPGIAQELDPRRRVDEDDHEARFDRIDSRSPSQPEPRSALAWLTVATVASSRNAKFTASRLVRSP